MEQGKFRVLLGTRTARVHPDLVTHTICVCVRAPVHVCLKPVDNEDFYLIEFLTIIVYDCKAKGNLYHFWFSILRTGIPLICQTRLVDIHNQIHAHVLSNYRISHIDNKKKNPRHVLKGL